MRLFIFFGLCLFLDVVISLDQDRDCKCRTMSKKRIVGGQYTRVVY